MSIHKLMTALSVSLMISSCTEKTPEYKSYNDYPIPDETNLWLSYSKESSTFKLWSPVAQEVRLNLYKAGNGGEPFETYSLEKRENGLWDKKVSGDLNGTYYTYQVQTNDQWLAETPGIYAQAVGVNGKRAMVLDLESTNPENWNQDRGPSLKSPNNAIIYEMHVRDITIDPSSGSHAPGKYLGLVEEGTVSTDGLSTGIDHIKEMGVTHVHIQPMQDFYSIDETKLDSPQFNWGYDPQNYNAPDGSFSSDPYHAEVRIKEFKKMVKGFHDNGLGVVMDVVYNHTGRNDESNFNLELPGYYYRHWDDGSYSDAAACGNETASEREMVRRFIIQSVCYWAKEYHVDGFRFDLMGIHDIETMNQVAVALKAIDPNIIIYGEGWTAGDSPLPIDQRSLKKNMQKLPSISAFSDDIRDGLKGSVFEESSTGFVSGAKDTEESVKFGVVGSIQHDQIDYSKVNYSKTPWTNDPWQAISYVSCHDNNTLYDKLKLSRKDASENDIIAMDKLANAVVFTSQGIPFFLAGEEMLRTKNGFDNSFNLPDSINEIDWHRKKVHGDVVEYYKNLISLRKTHPAFRMPDAESVNANLEFKTVEDGLISYQISNNANGDPWNKILVIYNARTKSVKYTLEGAWQIAVMENEFAKENFKSAKGSVNVPPISMAVLFQE